MEISDKVAVVTGSAAGTARVVALILARHDAHVVIADIDNDGAQQVSTAIAAQGGKSSAVRTDVCNDRDVDAMLSMAADLGGPHILVNNAGGWDTSRQQFPHASTEQWDAVLDLNLRAPMLITQRCLALMIRAGTGAIVNIASSAGLEHGPHASPEYITAKAGVIRFSTALGQLEEAPGIRVNCVAPGWIGLPAAHAQLAQMSPAQRAAIPPLIPPEVVADAVVSVIRDDALSGRALVLTGGQPPRLL